MKYVDAMNHFEADTATAPISHLFYILKKLHRTSFAPAWIDANGGGDFVVRFARAVRARLFRERVAPSYHYRIILNALDPPHCRCGKPGTRMTRGTTHCLECGPPTTIKAAVARTQRRTERLGSAINERLKAKDAYDLAFKSLHRSTKGQRTRFK